jgi:hypothetical protein
MGAVCRTVQPPYAGGGGYGQNEYGSKYLTAGTLFAHGTSSAVAGHVSSHHVGLSAGGTATVNLGFLRTVRRGLSSAGRSSAVVEGNRQLSYGLTSHGSSAMTVSWVRRKCPVTLVSIGGSTSTLFCHRRRIHSLHVYGTSLAVAVGRNSNSLPPPVMTGLRVTNYTRPAAGLGIRVFSMAQPAPTASLRLTRWSAPV